MRERDLINTGTDNNMKGDERRREFYLNIISRIKLSNNLNSGGKRDSHGGKGCRLLSRMGFHTDGRWSPRSKFMVGPCCLMRMASAGDHQLLEEENSRSHPH